MTKWTPAERELLAKVYPDCNLPRPQIAEMFGREWDAIEQKAIKLGLKRSRPSNGVRQDYFEKITRTIQAYLLGLLAADGAVTITDRRTNVKLEVQSKDRLLVERFRDEVAPLAPVVERPHSVLVQVG